MIKVLAEYRGSQVGLNYAEAFEVLRKMKGELYLTYLKNSYWRTYNFKKDYIPYGKQTIDHEDIKNVVNVLKSDFLTQGPKILNLKNKSLLLSVQNIQ